MKEALRKKGDTFFPSFDKTGNPGKLADLFALKNGSPPLFFSVSLIFLLGLLVYSNTFSVPFHFDDILITVHKHRVNALASLWPPSGSRWFGFLTFALNYRMHGLEVTGYHIVNVAIHIMNAVLVYFLVILSLRTPGLARSPLKDRSTVIGLFSGLFFVAHPLQTQAVTYIVQRFASLATMFYLLSLVMYIKARLEDREAEDRGQNEEAAPKAVRIKPLFYTASLLCSILAMETKEISFTLPAVIALYEFMFFHGSMKRRLLVLFPLLLTMLIIPLTLLGADRPLGDVLGDVSEAAGGGTVLSPWAYLLTQFRVIVTYLRLLFLPIHLNFDYDYPVYRSFADPEVFLSFLLLAALLGMGAFLLYRSRRSAQSAGTPPPSEYRLISFCIFWFFITLSVESSVIPIADVIFEHRAYLPSVGFFAAVIAALEMLAARWGGRSAYARKTAVYVMVVLVLVLSASAYARNALWMTRAGLLEDMAIKSPNKVRVRYSLGLAYAEQGRIDEAIGEYRTVVQLDPAFTDVYNYLGIAYVMQGRFDEAINAYTAALKRKPADVDVRYNLANAFAQQGRTDEAVREYKETLKLNAGDPKVHYFLGVAYAKQGRINEAIREYQTVLMLNPADAVTRNNLGNAYKKQGRVEEAVNEFRTALRLRPDLVEAHYNLGNMYASIGRREEAIAEFRTALDHKPDFPEARRQLDKFVKE